MIRIEVAYALPQRQAIIGLQVDDGCCALDAIQQSGIIGEFPEIALDSLRCGIFGTPVADPRLQRLREGDRIEIYRPLLIDPKIVRKERAARHKKPRPVRG